MKEHTLKELIEEYNLSATLSNREVICTGLPIDVHSPIFAGESVLILAPPRIGKTSLMMQTIMRLLGDEKKITLFVSNRTLRDNCFGRLLSHVSGGEINSFEELTPDNPQFMRTLDRICEMEFSIAEGRFMLSEVIEKLDSISDSDCDVFCFDDIDNLLIGTDLSKAVRRIETASKGRTCIVTLSSPNTAGSYKASEELGVLSSDTDGLFDTIISIYPGDYYDQNLTEIIEFRIKKKFRREVFYELEWDGRALIFKNLTWDRRHEILLEYNEKYRSMHESMNNDSELDAQQSPIED